jgi:hypothetical protein
MNFEMDDLLDEVDEWKFKLYEELKAMTPEQGATFWKQATAGARAAGLTVVEAGVPSPRRAKGASRATG